MRRRRPDHRRRAIMISSLPQPQATPRSVRGGEVLQWLQSMISLTHRWADAKEALRELDPEYVNRNENTAGLQRIGLEPPWLVNPNSRPRRRLPKEWHLLLEACAELVLQGTCLQVAAEGLSANGNRELPCVEAGKRQAYHHRSWFIHAKTLTDRTGHIIKQTSNLNVIGPSLARELRKRHRESVYEKITQ